MKEKHKPNCASIKCGVDCPDLWHSCDCGFEPTPEPEKEKITIKPGESKIFEANGFVLEQDGDNLIATPTPDWREMGKNSKMLLNFFFEGKKGNAVVFTTPKGNFLSPKAVENLLASEKEKWENMPMGVSQWREYGKKFGYWEFFTKDFKERILEAMPKSMAYFIPQIITNNKLNPKEVLPETLGAFSYNQALQEVAKIIKEIN